MDVTTGKHTRWPMVRLGDVCEIIGGSTPSKSNPVFWKTQDVSWFTVDDIRSQGRFITSTAKFVSMQAVVSTSLKIIPSESVLICCTASVGEYAITGIPLTTNQQFNGLVIKNKHILNPKYLFYFASSIKPLLLKLSGQTTVAFVSQDKVKTILLPLPPLAEQQRIVARLDAAFAAIAEASAAAAANLRNARALFDGFLQSKYNSWVEQFPSVKLNYLAQHITDGDHMPPPKASSGIPFITIGNIDKNTRKVLFDDTFFVSLEYYQSLKSNRKPQLGDILYTVTGSYGIPVLITADNSFCFQRHIGLIRPKTNIDSKWMYFMLLSPQIISQAHDGATGTAQKTVSLSVLRNYDVPSLPYQVQLSEAGLIEKVEFNTTQLTAIYERKLAALTELKLSLLAEVFGAA
jgi:type I restriction enzyme, S subunit